MIVIEERTMIVAGVNHITHLLGKSRFNYLLCHINFVPLVQVILACIHCGDIHAMLVTLYHITDREHMNILVNINDDTSIIFNIIQCLISMLSGKLTNGLNELILL
jgi:hypothetical protein